MEVPQHSPTREDPRAECAKLHAILSCWRDTQQGQFPDIDSVGVSQGSSPPRIFIGCLEVMCKHRRRELMESLTALLPGANVEITNDEYL